MELELEERATGLAAIGPDLLADAHGLEVVRYAPSLGQCRVLARQYRDRSEDELIDAYERLALANQRRAMTPEPEPEPEPVSSAATATRPITVVVRHRTQARGQSRRPAARRTRRAAQRAGPADPEPPSPPPPSRVAA